MWELGLPAVVLVVLVQNISTSNAATTSAYNGGAGLTSSITGSAVARGGVVLSVELFQQKIKQQVVQQLLVVEMMIDYNGGFNGGNGTANTGGGMVGGSGASSGTQAYASDSWWFWCNYLTIQIK